MKIIFFINKGNGFANSMILYMNEKFPYIDKDFYVIDRKNSECLPDNDNVHKILSYKEFLLNSDLKKKIIDSDKIIVSGVFTLQYVLPFFGKKVLKKTLWQFWGGDYSVFVLEEKTFLKLVRKKFINICLKNALGIILLTEIEKKMFLNAFHYFSNSKFYYVPVPSCKRDIEKLVEIRNLNKNLLVKKRRIIIGNSATATNQHFEIFKKLIRMDLTEFDIFCPLSYGDADYRNRVIEEGKKLFGLNFYPVTEYMKYEDYLSFLSTCDIGIYNHNRQQSMGNITIMLNLGKKVYAPNDMCLHYSKYNYKIYSIDELNVCSKEDFLFFSSKDAINNIACDDERQKTFYLNWKQILEEDL